MPICTLVDGRLMFEAFLFTTNKAGLLQHLHVRACDRLLLVAASASAFPLIAEASCPVLNIPGASVQ